MRESECSRFQKQPRRGRVENPIGILNLVQDLGYVRLTSCSLSYKYRLLGIFTRKLQGGELMQKDPVCGMMVDEKKTKLTSKHDNKTFYFCSASCKTAFDKDSHRYGHA